MQFSKLQSELGLVDSYEHTSSRNLKDPGSRTPSNPRTAIRAFVNEPGNWASRQALYVSGRRRDGPGRYRLSIPYLHDRVHTICIDEAISCVDLLQPFSKINDRGRCG